jgi:hypothetical protein
VGAKLFSKTLTGIPPLQAGNPLALITPESLQAPEYSLHVCLSRLVDTLEWFRRYNIQVSIQETTVFRFHKEKKFYHPGRIFRFRPSNLNGGRSSERKSLVVDVEKDWKENVLRSPGHLTVAPPLLMLPGSQMVDSHGESHLDVHGLSSQGLSSHAARRCYHIFYPEKEQWRTYQYVSQQEECLRWTDGTEVHYLSPRSVSRYISAVSLGCGESTLVYINVFLDALHILQCLRAVKPELWSTDVLFSQYAWTCTGKTLDPFFSIKPLPASPSPIWESTKIQREEKCPKEEAQLQNEEWDDYLERQDQDFIKAEAANRKRYI